MQAFLAFLLQHLLADGWLRGTQSQQDLRHGLTGLIGEHLRLITLDGFEIDQGSGLWV